MPPDSSFVMGSLSTPHHAWAGGAFFRDLMKYSG